MDTISYDDFAKLDIRIGTIKSAERVPEADKLLKLVFDMGSGEERQIMAGIAEHVSDPAALVGRQVPVLVNLKPRTMRGYESQGMMLAASLPAQAGDENGAPALLSPERDLPPGSKVT